MKLYTMPLSGWSIIIMLLVEPKFTQAVNALLCDKKRCFQSTSEGGRWHRLLVTLIDNDGMTLEQLITEVTLHLLFDEHDETLCEWDNPSVHVVVGLLNAALRVHKPCPLLLYRHRHVRHRTNSIISPLRLSHGTGYGTYSSRGGYVAE